MNFKNKDMRNNNITKVIKKGQEIIKKDYEILPDDEIIYKQVDNDEF
jgi:hypothetical protein